MTRWVWALICFGAANHVLFADSATIKANRVVVRAKPDRQSESLFQLDKGDSVEFLPLDKQEKSYDSKWAKIQLPVSAVVWLRKDLVHQNVVTKEGAYVRAGPSLNYSTLGKLKASDKIEIIKEHGEWVALKPLPGVAGWVAIEFLQTKAIAQTQQPAPVISSTVDISVGNNTAPTAPVATLPGPPSADPRTLPAVSLPVPVDKLVTTGVTREGTLKEHTGIFQRPGTHELWNEKELKPHLICYLDSSDQNLARYVGKRVQVSGEEHPVQGWDQPLLVAKQIKIVD